MPLGWDERMRLLRVVGLAEEVLGAAQASRDEAARAGLGDHIGFLMREVHAVLSASDAAAADEFERIVMRGPEADIQPELHAAALVGWVKAELTTQALDEKHEEEVAARPRKKQTIGFKLRSPITREHTVPEGRQSE